MTESIVQNLPCGYLEFDDNGILKTTNDRLSEWLGYKEGELAEKHINTLLTAGAKIFIQTHLLPLIKLEKRVEEIYITLKAKNGEQLPVLLNAESDVSAQYPLNRCVLIRMKNRSAYEDRLLQDKKEAKKNADEKKQLLSRMSHEIRNPLNIILGMVDELLEIFDEEDDKREEVSKYLQMIEGAGTDLARLADDILNFAKLESGYFNIELETVDLDEVLENAMMMVQHKAEEKNITIATTDNPNIKVRADRDRLKQIIMNLLTNAIKYTQPDGKVLLSFRKDGEMVKLSIKDSGIGISPKKLDSIFQPFIQVNEQNSKTAQGGVGLGLPISKKLAQLMNGDLIVTSTHGEGSEFTLEIPGC